jgi:hypothetical protein
MIPLRKRILILAACSAVVFGLGTPAIGRAQTKATKTKTSASKPSTKQETAAPVDLNTASEKDLDSLPGVGPATAKKIIAGRPYSSVAGLSKAGVSAATIKKITPLVTVSGGTTAAETAKTKTRSSARKSAKEATPPAKESPATSSRPAPMAAPKTATPSAARGSAGAGMVWVNLDSGVYHYEGTRYYGKTKNGKYMSEADAVKAGYHPAKNEKKSQ